MSDNPFATPPQDGGGKMIFAAYQMVPVKIEFEAGAVMELDRYLDREGNPWQFRGKKSSNKKDARTMVIQDLTVERRDGTEYVMFRDWMWSEKDKGYKAVIASHKQHFGADLSGIHGQTVQAQLEEVEYQDKTYNKAAFRVVKVFKNAKERNAAREAYFSQFSNGNGGDTESSGPAFDADTLAMIAKQYKAKKSAESIVDGYIDESIIEQFGGRDATVEAVKALHPF